MGYPINRECTSCVGLGWGNKLAKKLPVLSEQKEKLFLAVLLGELNLEFALQLDKEPMVDRLLHTPEDGSSQSIIMCGSSQW